MTCRVLSCARRREVSCQQGIESSLLTWHVRPFAGFCRRRVLPFEPCDGAALFCPGSVCAPANEWSIIKSEQTLSEWIKELNLRSIRWSAAVLLVMGSWNLIRSSARPYWLVWTGATGKPDLISMGSDLAIWATPVFVGWSVCIQQWHMACLLSRMVCLSPHVIAFPRTQPVSNQLF